jgi:homoserine kinase
MFAVKVPATSANLGPGFDTMGLALELYLEVQLEIKSSRDIELYFNGDDKEIIDNKPEDNLLIRAMNRVFQESGREMPGLRLTVENRIPFGKGLGSSAAAIVAGVHAADFLLEQRFSRKQLLKWAVEMEGHADNIVPAVAGGLTTVMLYDGQVYFQKLDFPDEIELIVAIPDFNLPTEKARSILPEKIELKKTVANLQRACFFLASIYNSDFNSINMAMDDTIYQPLRKQFIPGFEQVLHEAGNSGALGVALSGAGPSILAFTINNKEVIGEAMQRAFKANGINSRIIYLRANNSGVKIFT